MRTSKPISVTLGRLQEAVERRVASGQYSSASEVLREGLRALEREDAALEAMLKREVEASHADNSPLLSSEEVLAQIDAFHVHHVKRRRREAA